MDQLETPMAAAIAVSGAAAPVQTIKGLAYFLGTQEAARRTILPLAKEIKQVLNKEEVKYEYTELKDLFPEDKRDIADIGEFIIYGAGARVFRNYVRSPGMQSKLAAARFKVLKALGVTQFHFQFVLLRFRV